MKIQKSLVTSAVLGAMISVYASHSVATGFGNNVKIDRVLIGKDNNSFENPIVQPQDPALAGGGRDQSLRFGDLLLGNHKDELMIGGLGVDVLAGNRGDDVMIGGLEHFTENDADGRPLGRQDRAFGGRGEDIFLWKPGDASDFFHGGSSQDAIVFGLVGENKDGGTAFEVVNDGKAGDVFIDPITNLPLIDVTNSPGFCEVIDRGTSHEAAKELDKLGLDHLIRFSLRGVRDNFEAGVQKDDNGVRVTLHLKDVEVLVCTSREGGEIEILDLTVSPPQPIYNKNQLRKTLRKRLDEMVL